MICTPTKSHFFIFKQVALPIKTVQDPPFVTCVAASQR